MGYGPFANIGFNGADTDTYFTWAITGFAQNR